MDTSAVPRTRDVWRRHPGYVGAYAVDLFLALSLGISAVVTPYRFQAPAYAPMREVGIEWWGVALLLGAMLLIIGAFTTTKITTVVLTVGAMVYMVIGLWFVMATIADDRASFWSVFIFVGLALWHMTQANEYRRAA